MDAEFRRYAIEQAREYMQHVRSLNHTVKQVQGEIAELNALASGLTGIDYSRVRVSSTQPNDRMERLIIRKNSMLEEYAEELAGYMEEQHEAGRLLKNLEQPYARLLSLRYLRGKMWAAVAKELHHDEAYVRATLHNEALAQLYPYLPTRWRDPRPPAV